jgi:hypothetical protein
LALGKNTRRLHRKSGVLARNFGYKRQLVLFLSKHHLLAPFIQYLPRAFQHHIVKWTPRGILQPEIVHQIVDEVRLLTYSEMKQLFPDCVILKERVLGLTKSYIAVRAPNLGLGTVAASAKTHLSNVAAAQRVE